MKLWIVMTAQLVLGHFLAQTVWAERCVECHRARSEPRLRSPVFDEQAGAHEAAGLSCVDCHLGDPDEPGPAAHDIAAGFVGRPGRLGTLRVCGRCHDGSTDAAAVSAAYRGGAHGEAVAAGRVAAVCSDCHGSHGIAAPDSSTSSRPCMGCHADASTMRASELPTDQADQWTQSVHGVTAAAGNERSPRCADCHDGHSNSAGVRASNACGRCHENIRAAFERGPHAQAFTRLGFLDCVECHGSHEVAVPSARILTGATAVCVRCHGTGQPAFEKVRDLSQLAAGVDRARLLPHGDARRDAVIFALHALDTSALSIALDGIEVETEVPPPPVGLAAWTWELGALVLIVLAFVWRGFRRKKR